MPATSLAFSHQSIMVALFLLLSSLLSPDLPEINRRLPGFHPRFLVTAWFSSFALAASRSTFCLGRRRESRHSLFEVPGPHLTRIQSLPHSLNALVSITNPHLSVRRSPGGSVPLASQFSTPTNMQNVNPV